MNEQHTEAKMISIWTWIGMVLIIYGVIITVLGVYYVFVPETQTATAKYNPSLWWGIIMVVSAVLFLFFGRRKDKAPAEKIGQ